MICEATSLEAQINAHISLRSAQPSQSDKHGKLLTGLCSRKLFNLGRFQRAGAKMVLPHMW